MGKVNRTRRNTRKADQFKTFTAARRKNTEKPGDEDALDQLVESRTEAFVKLFERFEKAKITDKEAAIIATHATNDPFMSHPENKDLTDLADLKVEELTASEYQRVMTRAIKALNTIVETRLNFSAGPFFVNRHLRRGKAAMVFLSLRVKIPTGWGGHAGKSVSPAKIVANMRLRRESRNALFGNQR